MHFIAIKKNVLNLTVKRDTLVYLAMSIICILYTNKMQITSVLYLLYV